MQLHIKQKGKVTRIVKMCADNIPPKDCKARRAAVMAGNGAGIALFIVSTAMDAQDVAQIAGVL